MQPVSTTNLTDASTLLQMLADRDMRFVDAVLAEHRPEVLQQVVNQWINDRRAWAWEEANRYFLRGISSLGHEVVVKRLIRAGVAQRRDRTVAAALVYCDRLVRRRWKNRYSPSQGGWIRVPVSVRDALPRVHASPSQRAMQFERFDGGEIDGTLFRHATRYYLRRKVWRFFRERALVEPRVYIDSIGYALRNYTDADTKDGITLMQRPSLLKIGYGSHRGLKFDSRRAFLVGDNRLEAIVSRPAPLYPSHWRTEPGRLQLGRLKREARSQFIREWASAVS